MQEGKQSTKYSRFSPCGVTEIHAIDQFMQNSIIQKTTTTISLILNQIIKNPLNKKKKDCPLQKK